MHRRIIIALPIAILLTLVSRPALVSRLEIASASDRAVAQAQGEVGPDAVWQPTADQLEELETCFENVINSCSPALVMGTQGAPAAAIDFTNRRPFGEFLAAFEEHGPVDLGQIYLPHTNYLIRYEMLNGNPPVVASDSIGFADMGAIPAYAALLAQYPDLMLWPVATAGRGETTAAGQRFTFTYPLVDGCHACENLGTGQVTFDFDAAGNYLGFTHLGPLSADPTPTPPPDPASPHAPGQIAYVQDGNIWLIQDDGSDKQQLTTSGADCCLDWSPDGQRLYFIRSAKTKDDPETDPSGVIMAYDFQTGAEQSFSVPADIDVSNALAVSPDGRSLAFSSTAWVQVETFGEVHEGCLYVLDIAAGEVTQVNCAAPGAFYDIAYAPDGSLAVELGQYEGSRPAFYEAPTLERRYDDGICCYDMEYSADGADLYTVGGGYGSPTSDLRVYRAGERAPRVLQEESVESGSFGSPDLSPEGDRLAYSFAGQVYIMDLATLATTPLATGYWPAWWPEQAAPVVDDLLDRKAAAIEQLETTAYETSAGVIYPEPVAAFDESAARALVDGWRADATAVTPQQAAAFERLVMQEEALVPLLGDYTALAGDQADVAVDLAGVFSGTVLLGAKASSNLAAAMGDLLKKAVEDFIKLLLRFIDNETLREGTSNGIGLAIELIGVVDGTIDADDATSLSEEFLERAQDDGVRAVAFGELIPALVEPAQPMLDQGVRSAAGTGEPAWGVADPVEAAALGLEGLTTQSAIMRELAHDVYVNSLGRGRDVNEFLKDITDLALLGTRNPIGLIFSVQTRLQQILIDAAAASVLSEAMTCTRDAALASGDYAFQPDRPVFGCEVPVPINLGDFFDRLFSEGRKEKHLARMGSAAQSSPELAAALADYRTALDGLQSALNAADAAGVEARANELSVAAQTFEQRTAPILARLGSADGAADLEGEMALGVAMTLVRLDAAFVLMAADQWLADPAAADTVALRQVLDAAASGGDRLDRVLAQVPLPAPPEVALPVIDGPTRIFATVGEPEAIPFLSLIHI